MTTVAVAKINTVWLLFLSLQAVLSQEACLKWHTISDQGALCNDFSQAGYFVRRNGSASQKWIVYLESGGFCVSGRTCNRRFTAADHRGRDILTDFDVAQVWRSACPKAENSNRTFDLSNDSQCVAQRVLSPLMTSLSRYSPDGGGDYVIEGRDFLSPDSKTNPQFADFNHVLIPYCSSDLWLGNDLRPGPSDQFRFNPAQTSSIQFTFRGARILRSAMEDLLTLHSMNSSSEVVFIGSSAGGVGIASHLKWMRERLHNSSHSAGLQPPTISSILDSAWFIDFRQSLSELLTGEGLDDGVSGNQTKKTIDEQLLTSELYLAIRDIESCSFNVSNTSIIPCCLVPSCVLTKPDLYPVSEVPTLLVQSLYDVFVLAVSFRDESILGGSSGNSSNKCPLDLCSAWDGNTGNPSSMLGGFSISYIQRASEYAGVMNTSIVGAAQENPLLSYYITSCFQHVYFAPSSLVGGEDAVFGTNADLFASGQFSSYIQHTQESGRWSNIFMPVWPSGRWNNTGTMSIQQAIAYWMDEECGGGRNSSCSPLYIRQSCLEPHCNVDVCPEKINYTVSTDHVWPRFAIYIVAALVLIIALISFTIFAVLKLHYLIVSYMQQRHITRHSYTQLSSTVGPYSFPTVMVGGYSIACKNLNYSVKYQRKKQRATDESQLLVLAGIDINPNQLSLSSATFQRNQNANGNLDDKLADNLESEPPMPQTLPPSFDQTVNGFDSFNNSLQYDNFGEFSNTKGSHNKTNDPAATMGQEEVQVDFYDDYSTLDSLQIGTMSGHNTVRRPGLRRTPTQLSVTVAKQYVSKQVEDLKNTGTFSKVESSLSAKTKNILKDVSLYFNPGELVAIMGPSGCGKTTLLDILTGRRRDGTIQGDVLINGFPLNLVRSDFVDNTGYLMQLVAPYYEELTVRENLTLAAQLRLPHNMSYRERFRRIENVISEVHLEEKVDALVGGSYGPGLSGGQKRRLAIAIQLLNEPQVLVLDEPTSGLDSSASFDLLTMLNQMTKSRRTIIMTIHQPRLEIFHMFNKIVFLCEGQVAYFGKPALAYEVCTMALKKKLAAKNQVWLGLEDQNPADIIVDMLGNRRFRRILIEHYNESREPKWVKRAIKQATYNADVSIYNKESTDGSVKISAEKPTTISRLSAFEARAAKRAPIGQLLYLPLFFALYGLLLGSVYLHTANPFLIVSGFCVYSVASALFMFPAMHLSFSKALDLYTIERLDGIGRSFDLVIQGFTRFVTLALVPVIICAAILYLMAIPPASYSLETFLQLTLINVALNQTWVALLTLVITAFPSYCIRISPVLASVFGFASGFFIPVKQMPPWWCWLFYINPNFYGFSSSAFVLLSTYKPDGSCTSELECYVSSGRSILEQFHFTAINPYLNIIILMCMTVVFLLAATIAMAIRHTDFKTKWLQFSLTFKTKVKQMKGAPSSLKRTFSTYSTRLANRHGSTEAVNMESRTQTTREARPSLLESHIDGPGATTTSFTQASESSSDIDYDDELVGQEHASNDDSLTSDADSDSESERRADDFEEELQRAFDNDPDTLPSVATASRRHLSSSSEPDVDWPGYRTVPQTQDGHLHQHIIPLTPKRKISHPISAGEEVKPLLLPEEEMLQEKSPPKEEMGEILLEAKQEGDGHMVSGEDFPDSAVYENVHTGDKGYHQGLDTSRQQQQQQQQQPLTKPTSHLYATEPRGRQRSSSFNAVQSELDDQVPELPSLLPARQQIGSTGFDSRLSSSTSAVNTPVPPSPGYNRFHPSRNASSRSKKQPVMYTKSAHNIQMHSVSELDTLQNSHYYQRSVSTRNTRSRNRNKSMYLDEERHNVWTPHHKQQQQQPQQPQQQQLDEEVPPTPGLPVKPSVNPISQSPSMAEMQKPSLVDLTHEAVSSSTLLESKKEIESRIQAAKEIGREVTNQIAVGNNKWERNYTRMVTKRQKKRNRMNLNVWQQELDNNAGEEVDGDFGRRATRRRRTVKKDSGIMQPPEGIQNVKNLDSKMTKSPSMPLGIQETSVDQAEMTFDTLRKRKQGEGWRKGMKKVLVQAAKSRPLPIQVYKQLLLESQPRGGGDGQGGNRSSAISSQRHSRPLSASLEESGTKHSKNGGNPPRQRQAFNRMSMPASKVPVRGVRPPAATEMGQRPEPPTPVYSARLHNVNSISEAPNEDNDEVFRPPSSTPC